MNKTLTNAEPLEVKTFRIYWHIHHVILQDVYMYLKCTADH